MILRTRNNASAEPPSPCLHDRASESQPRSSLRFSRAAERPEAGRSLGAGGGSIKATPSQGVAGSRLRRSREARILVPLEVVTGAAALIGGVLFAIAPDGSLLSADVAALEGSPFTDWRLPGLLLGGFVGGGFLVAGSWQWRNRWHARELSMLAGLGLMAFEVAEVAWIGFQPLEAVFALVGAAVLALAATRGQQ